MFVATVRLGIDMGSSTTTIFRVNSGLVLREPSKVLCEKTSKGMLVREVGLRAERLQGKTPDYMNIVSPIKEGLVDDVKMASKMLKVFVQHVTDDAPNAKVDALINIPCGAEIEDRRKVAVVAYNAGITSVNLIPNIVACALGAGCDITSAQNFLIVDIGGGCTDIGVVGLCSIIHGITLNIGATQMDQAIQDYIKSKFNLHINLNVAQMLKEEIGSLLERDTASMQVSGIDIDTKELRSINVSAALVCDAIHEFYELIAESINAMTSACSPEVLTSIYSVGVIFCGNGGQIVGLDKFMQDRLGLKVCVADGNCTAIGLGMILNDKQLLKTITKENL